MSSELHLPGNETTATLTPGAAVEQSPSMAASAVEDAAAVSAPAGSAVGPAETSADAPPLTGSGSSPAAVAARGLWHWIMPSVIFVALVMLVLYITPYLLVHWRVREALAEAESTYLKRRAELKAEAEHADVRLGELNDRVQLASLGFREVVRRVAPSVVTVTNLLEPDSKDFPRFVKPTLVYDSETGRNYLQVGAGSGLIVAPGVILTNHHVVHGAQRLRIVFASGRLYSVDKSTVATDSITDLAVVRLPVTVPPEIEEESRATVEFADSDKDVQVGDFTLALGSPLGLKQTVTQGVISAKGRLLGMLDLVELLQTDAAINPGNSGGPLFDHRGKVAGINVAIASETGGNQGIGFAIPSNTVKRIVEQLVNQGEVPRGYLGIALDEVSGAKAKKLGVSDGAIVVMKVMPDEAAANAGIQEGDVVVGINGEPLSRHQPVRHFRQLIVDTPPDGQAVLEVLRDGERQEITVKVAKRPSKLR
jgi:S1-C subfamily serine protease